MGGLPDSRLAIIRTMATWKEIEESEPGFAACAKGIFDKQAHKTIATIRKDGSPRISGTELIFAEGRVFFGAMKGSRRAEDIKRDARIAIHSGSEDPPEWKADAKLSGIAVPIKNEETRKRITGKDWDFDLFEIDIREVAIVGLSEDEESLVIDYWSEDRGLQQMNRS